MPRRRVQGVRPAEQPPLGEPDAEVAQARRLRARLDPLRQERDPHRLRERDDRRDEAGEDRVVGDPGDERTVDLHQVRREQHDVVERAVAGAEVVDGQAHPPEAQHRQRGDDLGVHLHGRVLGELDDDPRAGVEPDEVEQGRVEQRLRREVDRDVLVRPGPGQPRQAEGDRVQLELLEQSDPAGLGEPEVRAMDGEARERLIPVDLPGVDGGDGLKNHVHPARGHEGQHGPSALLEPVDRLSLRIGPHRELVRRAPLGAEAGPERDRRGAKQQEGDDERERPQRVSAPAGGPQLAQLVDREADEERVREATGEHHERAECALTHCPPAPFDSCL